jgi:uncharacterized membrane protein YfcA
MWSTDTLWFEVAVVSIIYATGNLFFGHFEEQTPKWRRLGKYVLTLIIVLALSAFVGRWASMSLLGAMVVPLLYVHGYYLPKKKGINGWTGEPKRKYYAFRGWNTDVFGKEK